MKNKLPWSDTADAVLETPCAADFNDSHTHAEVLQLLRDAIDRAPVRPVTTVQP